MEIKLSGISSDGREAYIYSLQNRNGLKAWITNYGAAIISLYVPDKRGKFKAIKHGIESDYEQIRLAKGYDHNFVLNKQESCLEYCAEVYDPISERRMKVQQNPEYSYTPETDLMDG
jgi:galactose mutarotase-like enzyme